MQPLAPSLRQALGKAVQNARSSAEDAAHVALDRLGVGATTAPGYLTPDEAALRRRLRARGRALGDTRQESGAQGTAHLAAEVAYEHWHRLLFARFLAERGLLVHPEHGIPLTLQDCNDLAEHEGAGEDGFALAARYAAALLPGVFRAGDPVLDVALAPESRRTLRGLVLGLDVATFHADDALGWVYQFWQAKRKDEVNASGKKIGAEELPAVTQLFTEPYMVRFLLENTLGAWYAARHPGEPLPVEMRYLRRLDDGTPAAGRFEGWPSRAADLRVLDPCTGSGHFLVSLLHLLVPMRGAEERLSVADAVDAVLRDNLHGLELDPRCTQLAAFAVAFAAWTFPGAEGYRPLPELNVACCGLAPTGRVEEWERLAGDDLRLRNGMRRLWALFQDAPTLGSLLDPGTIGGTLDTAGIEELRPLLDAALAREADEEVQEQEVVAAGVAASAVFLGRRYHLVATNVPYRKRGDLDSTLGGFIDTHYAAGRRDLATAFLLRTLNLCAPGGAVALVTPQNWLFLGSYNALREHLLKTRTFDVIAPLGTRAFETITGEVVNVGLFSLTRSAPAKDHRMYGVDAVLLKTPADKDAAIRTAPLASVAQSAQLDNPDSRISLDSAVEATLLSTYANAWQGIASSDSPRFGRTFWELPELSGGWVKEQSTVANTTFHGGKEHVLFWEDGYGEMTAVCQKGATFRGKEAWQRPGVVISQMTSLAATLYTGEHFDNNSSVITPENEDHLAAIWAFASSPEYTAAVRRIDKKMGVTNATLVKVPFDLERWQAVADSKYPDGLPAPYSDAPTQWLFHGHPAPATRPLQVAVARLVGYRWPSELDDEMELSDEARRLVREACMLSRHADMDGVVPLVPVGGERPAADRLLDLMRDAYADKWSASMLAALLEGEGQKRGDLARWLRDGFFKAHCALFDNRPFVWHIWDGHPDGFGALVNAHRLDRAGLERLVYTYLGSWIARQETEAAGGDTGAEGRLAAARTLKRKLETILEGEPPYDVFVRWKQLEEQPIGWNPDLNDGVRVNIWPFVQAGVLRFAPNVKWGKDRGANPPGEHWGPVRHNRYEDLADADKLKDERGRIILHLTNAVKQAARDAAQAGR